MRNALLLIIICIAIVSCGKDKFTSAPQIKYKSISPNRVSSGISLGDPNIPILTINITDAEGDLGKLGKDTSYIYLRNILINRTDSFPLPNIQSVAAKNFQGDILINLFDVLRGSGRPRPRVDTLFFEVYVVDFAKHKSNVITTGDPLFYVFP